MSQFGHENHWTIPSHSGVSLCGCCCCSLPQCHSPSSSVSLHAVQTLWYTDTRTCLSAPLSLTLQGFVSSLLSGWCTGEMTVVTVLLSNSMCWTHIALHTSCLSSQEEVSLVEGAELEPAAGTIIPDGWSIHFRRRSGVPPLVLRHIDEGRVESRRISSRE